MTKLQAAQDRYKKATHGTKTGHWRALRQAMNAQLKLENEVKIVK